MYESHKFNKCLSKNWFSSLVWSGMPSHLTPVCPARSTPGSRDQFLRPHCPRPTHQI